MGKTKAGADVYPRGVAVVPQWWMDITPHNILDFDEEAEKREQQYQEAAYYAQLAARDDYLQYQAMYGDGEPRFGGGPGDGGGGDSWGGSKWAGRGPGGGGGDDGDAGPQGRQFKPGEVPEGYSAGGYYDPSKFMAGGAGGAASARSYPVAPGAAALNDAKYGRETNIGWQKPDWLKHKLRSTNTGDKIRHGDYSTATASGARPIGGGNTTAVKEDEEGEKEEDKAETEEDEEVVEEVVEEKDEGGVGKLVKRIRRKKKRASGKKGSSPKPTKKEPAWAKAMRPGADEGAIEASGQVKNSGPGVDEDEDIEEEYYEEEVVDDDDEDYVEESASEDEYSVEEYEEEVIVEDEDGNVVG